MPNMLTGWDSQFLYIGGTKVAGIRWACGGYRGDVYGKSVRKSNPMDIYFDTNAVVLTSDRFPTKEEAQKWVEKRVVERVRK